MSTTKTPTSRAAILDRITEPEVCEWLKAVAADRKTAEPAAKAYRSYSAEVDAAGDINNLLRFNGNSAACE